MSGAPVALANDCGLFYRQSVNYVLEVVIKVSYLSGLSTRAALSCHILIEDLNCNNFFLHFDIFPLFSISGMRKGLNLSHKSLYDSRESRLNGSAHY